MLTPTTANLLTEIGFSAALCALARPDNAARCGVWCAGDSHRRTDKCTGPYFLRSFAWQACQGVRIGGTGVPLLRTSALASMLLQLPLQCYFRCELSRGLTKSHLARLPLQVLRVAVHERPKDRSLMILHLHAQGSSFAATFLARARCLNAAPLSSVEVACRSNSY